MTVGDPVLSVSDLTVRARVAGDRPRELTLVEGVSFAVCSGEVLGIVGETGAGKTMATRAALGLLPRGVRADGTVVLGSERVALRDGDPMRRFLGRSTGIVLQNPLDMLDPLVRIGKQMLEGVTRARLMSRRDATVRATHLLQAMGLKDPERVLRSYPSELSGGMAQRVTIALALMPQPLVVAIDEPTSALDAQSRLEVLDLIRELCRAEGTAVLFISHDLDLIGRVCDRLIVMYAGRILEYGDTGAILDAPLHPYTKALLRCAPTLDSPPRTPLPFIEGAPPPPGAWPAGCVFAPRCPHVSPRALAERPILRQVEGRDVACHHAEQLIKDLV